MGVGLNMATPDQVATHIGPKLGVSENLEYLYSPMVQKITPLGDELLAMQQAFLSQMIFKTFNGHVVRQFKKTEQDSRNHGELRWKEAMHLLRLLLSGAATLRRQMAK